MKCCRVTFQNETSVAVMLRSVITFTAFYKMKLKFCCILSFISSGRNENVFVIIYRDESGYHNAGDYSVPYGGVPAHHNTWQHPDVQQMQNAQQDARQQQRYDMDSLFRFQDCF